MQIQMFKSKIHRATVTQADLDYEGSVTLDPELMELADIGEHEVVHIWNITQGTRLTTYALAGDRGSRVVCINGAAAHLATTGDLVIIAAFCHMSADEARDHQPRVVLVDAHNNPVSIRPEIPGPKRP